MRLVKRFAPPLLLMGLIFFLSAQPDLNSGLGIVGHGRCARSPTWPSTACCGSCGGGRWATGTRAAAIAITLLWAASDEYHQSFVDGRHGSPWDVAIDAVGVGLAGLLVARRAYSQPRSVA